MTVARPVNTVLVLHHHFVVLVSISRGINIVMFSNLLFQPKCMVDHRFVSIALLDLA